MCAMCKERTGSLIFCTESRVSRWTREDPRQESFSHTVRRRRPGDSPQLQQGRGQDQGGGSQPPATGGGGPTPGPGGRTGKWHLLSPVGGCPRNGAKCPPSAIQTSMDCWARRQPPEGLSAGRGVSLGHRAGRKGSRSNLEKDAHS